MTETLKALIHAHIEAVTQVGPDHPTATAIMALIEKEAGA